MRVVIPAAGAVAGSAPAAAWPLLLPVGGQSLIEHALREAAEAAMEEAVVLLPPADELVRRHLRSVAAPLLVRVAGLPAAPGLEAALLAASELVETPFAVLLPDSVVEGTDHWERLITLHGVSGATCLCVRHPRSVGGGLALVDCEVEGDHLQVTRLADPETAAGTGSATGRERCPWALIGRLVATEATLAGLRSQADGRSDPTAWLSPVIATEPGVKAIELVADFYPCVTPDDYERSVATRWYRHGVGREEDGRRRNERLVEHLVRAGALHEPGLRHAFLTTPRHHFVPERPLDEVYADEAIPTKLAEDGKGLSSSSQPAIMAIMLEQLRPAPGHRVLEIGAGTGYNAALLAKAAGSAGAVVSIDIDEDICRQAGEHLAAAGADQVQVERADGAGGWPVSAPYDRIIVTAHSPDIAPAWFEQLVVGGRLVLPLALDAPAHLSVAFVKQPGRLVSDGVACCNFVPLRGHLDYQAIERQRIDPELEAWADQAGRPVPGEVPAADLRGGFELWLALTEPGYRQLQHDTRFARFAVRYGEGAATLERQAASYLVRAHGEQGEAAARQLLNAYERWSLSRPGVDRLQVIALPSGKAGNARPREIAVRRRYFTFLLSWR